jgi:pimeloyl-ACP methyl ester carboxylesterase
VPYEEAHKIKKYLPQAELVTIERGSHYLPVEEDSWQKLAESLVSFLS